MSRILIRTVKRYGCPHCGRWRSSERQISSHAYRCWKNPEARTCGTCTNHIPPTKGENPSYFDGYPGSPPEPRCCLVEIDNVNYGMPRDCAGWVALTDEAAA